MAAHDGSGAELLIPEPRGGSAAVSRTTRTSSPVKGAVLIFLLVTLVPQARPDAEPPRVVSREEMLEAMTASQGYDPTATTNGARFQAEVLRRLALGESERRPDGPPLFLGHSNWFSAFLDRTGLTAEKAPTFIRLAYEHGQDIEMDYRRERVIESAEGVRLDFAANVIVWWPEKPGGPKSYSYEDLLSTPHLKVTNRRVITYRLLDLEGMVVYGQIEGLRGRPTSGLLGFLFKIIGEGRVVESRMLISPDGLQISRARAEKGPFNVTQTVTVYPDGHMEKDLPPNRPDLVLFENRLKLPLKIRFRPLDTRSR